MTGQETKLTETTAMERHEEHTPTPRRSGKFKSAAAVVLMAVGGLIGYSWLNGDADKEAQAQVQTEPAKPTVVLEAVENADLAAGREHIGRVESIQTVDLRPEVSGKIAEVHFKEGAMVKAGDLLFTLDSKQFQATVDLRKAELAQAQANHSRATKYHNRLKASDKRSVSASDLEMAESDVLQGKAAVDQAKAALKLAQIDLGYTKIAAPINGQIGKAAFTKGNYVTPASGPLASIVQLNPIRVAFALPDRDYLDQLDAFKASEGSVYNATIRLSNGEEYPLSGERDFEDNTMDDRTGTIMTRLRFQNDKGALVPGAMVRVLTKPVAERVAPVLSQEAILADNRGDYVYVVDSDNIVRQRRVVLGVEAGSKREVLSGLEPGEQVVVRGLQSIRPDMAVNPVSSGSGRMAKSPAELAMESGRDVQVIPVADAGSAEPEEGVKN